MKPFKQSFQIPGGFLEIEDRTPRGDPTFRFDVIFDDGRTYHIGRTCKEAMNSAAGQLRLMASKLDEIAGGFEP